MKGMSAVVLLALFLVGCGTQTPTLDTTNEETLQTSMKAMRETLPEEEAAQFATAIGKFGVKYMLPMAAKADAEKKEINLADALIDLHGLTAQQIIEKAKKDFADLDKTN
jgi:hypothetical protein